MVGDLCTFGVIRGQVVPVNPGRPDAMERGQSRRAGWTELGQPETVTGVTCVPLRPGLWARTGFGGGSTNDVATQNPAGDGPNTPGKRRRCGRGSARPATDTA